jgi:hypothetical protein
MQLPGGLPRGTAPEQLECNLRIATSASDDSVVCRVLRVRSAHSGSDFLPAICSKLRRSGAHAVRPLPAQGNSLILLGEAPFEAREVAGDQWRAEVGDAGRRELSLRDPRDAAVLADLLECVLVISFEKALGYWRLSSSTRYWYDPRPEASANGVEMIRRVSFSTLPLTDQGIGVALDFGHLFQTERTLDAFFDPHLSAAGGGELRRTFDRLAGRHERRKGTLLYSTGSQTLSKCYFSHADEAATCENTGPLVFGGNRYNSLYDYYRARWPRLDVQSDDPVIYVSFPGMNGAKSVAAKLLRLRVDLDPHKVPRELLTRTTIAPEVRSRLVEQMWRAFLESAVNESGFEVSQKFWSPGDERQELLPCPPLVFGQGRHVHGPRRADADDYGAYYRTRREKLQHGGIYIFDENSGRDLVLVTPNESPEWSSKLQRAFADDLVSQVSDLAGKTFRVRVVRAEGCEEIVAALKREKTGVAVIVFDDRERAAYSVLSHELSPWTIKRMTRRAIERTWKERERARSDLDLRRAQRAWNDLLFHSAVDVLDQMGAIPWRLDGWPYEACLAIDVSEQRRYFGLSLLICRDEKHWPSFYRATRTWPKGDHQYETIQATLLADKISRLMEDLRDMGDGFDPLDSVLILRDGRECGDEINGIEEGLERWRSLGVLGQEPIIDIAAVLKRSVKHVRMWMRAGDRVRNVLEGRAVYPDDDTAVVCCTGAGTLGGRATAEPIVVRAHNSSDIRRIARGVFALSQLNYSSPTKAHRSPQPLRELDAALRDRVDHDMRGIK